MAVCDEALHVVWALDGGGDSFGVKVGWRGSVLSSLLFISLSLLHDSGTRSHASQLNSWMYPGNPTRHPCFYHLY